MRRAFEGEPIYQFMTHNPITVPPDVPVADLVENYVYKHHHKMFPVLESNGKLVGCVTTRDIQSVPRNQWDQKTVGDVMHSCSDENTIDYGADAMQALSRMDNNRLSRLLVMRDGELQGIISLKDLLNFMSLKMELEDDA